MNKLIYLAVVLAYGYYYYKNHFRYPVKAPHELKDSYDYIVVGAGSAGAVVAARLTEDPSVSVLLLEAGSDGKDIPWSHVPGLPPFNQRISIDWQYLSEPQKQACLSLENQQSAWPRGKVLGGTSITNYMLHVRGSPADYNHWANHLHSPGWSYKDLLPYFKKLETAASPKTDSNFRGKDGPISAIPAPETDYGRAYLDAAKELGYPISPDYNGPKEKGFSRMEHSIKNGWRSSTAAEYLFPNRNRKNLHITTHATVSKINTAWCEEHSSWYASGVTYLHNGQSYTVKAGKEVVLSAGAVNSPQLLMLSGIGPKKDLEALGIKVIADLPNVGQNLQDHILIPILVTFNHSIDTEPSAPLSFKTVKRVAEWAVFGTGMASWPLVEVHSLLETEVKPPLSAPFPDLQHYMFVSDYSAGGDLAHLTNFVNPENLNAYFGNGKALGKPCATLFAGLLQPLSYGEIKLHSTNPLDSPLIDPKYLTNPRDMKVLLKGMKISLDLIKTKAMQKLGAGSPELPLPGCKQFTQWSDAYLECFIRHKTFTIYHPTGTCRIGKDGRTAVVDPELRVFGVKHLRVADASVFPNIPSGNTNIPAIMVGEKAADILKKSLKK